MPKMLQQLPPQRLMVTITPWSTPESISQKAAAGNAGPSFDSSRVSTAWPSANLAIFIPFYTRSRILVTNFFWMNGATVSGNSDMGLYTQDGIQIAHIGSTVQAGTSAMQVVAAAANLYLGQGLYYLALAADNVTATYGVGATGLLEMTRTLGMASMAAAFPLPATATLATITADYIPSCGISLGATF